MRTLAIVGGGGGSVKEAFLGLLDGSYSGGPKGHYKKS